MTDTAGDADPTETVRERLLADHGEVLDAVGSCADAVAERWDGDATTDRDAVVPAMRDALAAAGVSERLPDLLLTGADALGAALPASPVPAPPYLVVTATGPVVRATLPDVGRLVVSVDAFEIDRSGDSPRYRRRRGNAGDALSVDLR